MFKSEDEMQEKLYDFLQEREKEKNNPKFHFYREVEMVCNGMRPDILAFSSSEVVAYELKLKSCRKIEEQGFRAHCRFDKAYIVLPPVEALKAKEKPGEYGIMAYDGTSLKVLRGCKKKEKGRVLSDGRWEAMNAVVRGFYLGGINERGREDRQGW